MLHSKIKHEFNYPTTDTMIRNWYKAHTEKDKSHFTLNVWIILAVTGLMLIASNVEENDPDYFKAQNGLFLMCLIFLALIFIRRNGLIDIVKNSTNLIKRDRKISLEAFTDLIFLTTTILVMLSFIYVLDLEFISSNGIKVGGVVAVIFASLLSSLRKTFKKAE